MPPYPPVFKNKNKNKTMAHYQYVNGPTGPQGFRGGSNWTPVFTGGVGYGENSNTFYKLTNNSGNWDGQVYSVEGYTRGAYMACQPTTINSTLMVGLNSDPTQDANYASIDYAWYIAGGYSYIYEGGSYAGGAGAFTTDTVFSITYDGYNIRYWKYDPGVGNILVRTVTRAVGFPLYLDSSFVDTSTVDGIKNVVFGPMGEQGTQGPQGSSAIFSGTAGTLPKFTGTGTTIGNSVVVESGGNIGIGTTAPGSKLSVGLRGTSDGNIRLSAAGTGADSGASMLWDMNVGGGNPISHLAEIRPESYATGVNKNILNFYVGAWNNNADSGTSKMTITSDGLVGIGTTTPNEKLTVLGSDVTTFHGGGIYNSYAYGSISDKAESRFNLGKLEASVFQPMGAIGAFPSLNNDSAQGTLVFYTRTSQSVTEKMRINSSGNVGIGTTSDSGHKLDVAGAIRNVLPDPTGIGGITTKFLSYATSPYGLIFRAYVTGQLSIQNQREANDGEVFPLILQPNGSNVGIGTLLPTAKLNVKSSGASANTSTLFTDPYTRLSVSGIPAGGTPSLTYTTVSGASSVIQVGTGLAYAANLSLANVYNTVSATWPVFPTVNYSSILNANTATLQWTVNAHQTLNGTLTGFTPGGTQTGQAIVLACSGTNPSLAGTSGYALAYGVPGTGNTWSLIYFTNGLNATGGITLLLSSAATADPRGYFSLKVTYTPIANQWTLYYRMDATNGGTWANPLAGTYTTVGTVTNSTLTSTSLPYFSFVYNAQTGNGHFSNFSLTTINTVVYPDTIKSEDGNIRQTNGFSILENLTSVDAVSDAAAAALNVPLYGLYRTGNIVRVRTGGSTTTIDARPYKVYTAILNLTAPTSAPVPSVLENTIGNIVWTRGSNGQYSGTLAGAFPDVNKTFCLITGEMGSDATYGLKWSTTNSVFLVARLNGIASDNNLYNTSVEIRVYN